MFTDEIKTNIFQCETIITYYKLSHNKTNVWMLGEHCISTCRKNLSYQNPISSDNNLIIKT